MINLTDESGPSHDILIEEPPWLKGIFVFLLISTKSTFLPKNLDFRNTFGTWVFVEFTKEEASEGVGVVDVKGASRLLKLACKVPTREAIGKFSFRFAWIE